MNSRTYSLIGFVVFFSSLGNVLLSKGMKEIGEISSYSPSVLFSVFLKTFSSPMIWLGIASLLVFFVCYLLLLSWADFSFVQPVCAIGYAGVAILSYFLLGEIISPMRWVGVLFICGGVALVSGTEPRTVGD
jgi:drug/metabolite transporter (DMT)-like permease